MRGSTHLASGILVALAGHFFGLPKCSDIATMTGLVMGAVLPDVDKSTSTVGQRVPVIPKLFKRQHRGLTHSLVMVVGMYFVSPAIAIGCLIQLFWPIPAKIHLLSIRSGKKGDRIIGGIMWAFIVVLAAFISLHIDASDISRFWLLINR